MLQRISSWLHGDDKLVSLHLHILEDDNIQANILYLDLISGYIKVNKKISVLYSDINDIKDWPTKRAIVMITGKGVLSRKSSKVNVDLEAKFLELYPTSNISDFYISEYLSDRDSNLSFIKKDKLTHLFDSLHPKIEIVDVHVGYLSVLNIYESVLPNTITFSFQEGVVDKSEPLGIKGPTMIEEIELNEEKLPVKFGEAYLSALDFLIKGPSYNGLLRAKKAERLKLEYHFNRFLIVTACILFVVLIINTIVYYSYEDRYNDLQFKKSISGDTYSNVVQLKNNIEQKKKVISEIGLNNDLNIALLIQAISKDLPDGILFKSVEVFPTDVINSKDKMIFNNHQIIIIGESKDIVDVHEWIQELTSSKKMKANLESYARKTVHEMSQFKVVIDL